MVDGAPAISSGGGGGGDRKRGRRPRGGRGGRGGGAGNGNGNGAAGIGGAPGLAPPTGAPAAAGKGGSMTEQQLQRRQQLQQQNNAASVAVSNFVVFNKIEKKSKAIEPGPPAEKEARVCCTSLHPMLFPLRMASETRRLCARVPRAFGHDKVAREPLPAA